MNTDITSLTGLTTPLSVAQGGTNAITTAAARTSLGAAASGANTDITSLGAVTGVTATAGDNTTKLASTAFVQNAATSKIQPIEGTVAASALTLTLNPTSLDFRSTSFNLGVVSSRRVPTAITLTVPSGATLGTLSGIYAQLVLIAIDSAGTVELAVVNIAGGNNLDETTLLSTTAISGAALSASVVYSTTARTSVPFRVVGFAGSTQATAGTWATLPNPVQGAGGQAVTAMSSVGYGQTWQSVTRTSGVTYYNSTGKPIVFCFSGGSSGASGSLTITINGVTAASPTWASSAASGISTSHIIPPGASYSYTNVGYSVTTTELR